MLQSDELIATFESINENQTNGEHKTKVVYGDNELIITNNGRALVDTEFGYVSKSVNLFSTTAVAGGADHTILSTTGTGIIDEIHINCQSADFSITITIDGANVYTDLLFNDLSSKLNLGTGSGVTVSNLQTKTGTDIHITIPIYFATSALVKITNNAAGSKNITGYTLIYREG